MTATYHPKNQSELRAVVAYIVRDGLMLSIPRKDTGEHAAPGGRVEDGEEWLAALSREVAEEIGCRIVRAWEVHRGPVKTWSVRVYVVEIEGEPAAREPGTRIEWVQPSEIANGFGKELHREAVRRAGLLGR